MRGFVRARIGQKNGQGGLGAERGQDSPPTSATATVALRQKGCRQWWEPLGLVGKGGREGVGLARIDECRTGAAGLHNRIDNPSRAIAETMIGLSNLTGEERGDEFSAGYFAPPIAQDIDIDSKIDANPIAIAPTLKASTELSNISFLPSSFSFIIASSHSRFRLSALRKIS